MDRAGPTERQRWGDMAESLAGLGYWRMELATNTLRWSPNMFRIYGFEPGLQPPLDAAMGRVHPDDRAAAEQRLEAFIGGTPAPSKTRIVWPDGTMRYTEGRGACEYGPDGEVVAIFGIVMDVTERHRAEADLATHKAHLGLLAENGGDLIVEFDSARTIRYVSPAVRRLGYEPEQLIGVKAINFIHPQDLPKVARMTWEFTSGAPVDPAQDRTYRLIAADGAAVWMEGKPTPIRDEAGNLTGTISVLRDVSDRKTAEIALAQREAQLSVIAEHTHDVVVQFDLKGRIVYISPAARRYGYEPDELTGKPVASLIHPEDLAKVAAQVTELVSGKPVDPDRDRTQRVRAASGDYVWMEGQPVIVRDADGQPTSVVSLQRDIDEQRAAGEALARSEERYRLITDHTQDLIAVSDTSGLLTFVSPSSRTVLGYDPDEMIGTPSITYVHPEDRRQVAREVGAYVAAGPDAPAPQLQYRAIRKDGEIIWLEANPKAVHDKDGRLVALQDNTRDITARRAAEAALVESERRYRLLTDNATDVIACYDANAVFTFLAPAVSAVMGYAPEEMVGRRSTSFMHPDDVRPVLRAFRAFFAAGPGAEPIRFEYRAFRKDGEMIWLEAHPKAIYDADGAFVEFQDVVRDVTERKRVDAALAESEQRYRLLAENVTDIVSCADMDGRMTYLSPSVLGATGYSAAELVGRVMLDTIHPDDVPRAQAYFESAVRGDRKDGESLTYRSRHRSGEWRWMECNPTVVRDADGQPIQFVDVTRDVTARERLEKDLRAARDAAQAAAAVKSDFMANMSHEIRTPLTAVIGFSSLISARTDLDPTAREHADRIAGAGRALLDLVNDVLDFSKLEAGRMEFASRPADPAAVAHEALDLFTLQADSKGLDLTFDPDAALPACVALDAKAVSQVLRNLIGNAVKFSEAGGVTLAIAYDAAAQALKVAVRDTGPGLTPDQAGQLFQRFSQVDGSSTRRHGGTGLGLAISKGLVEAMGGEIGVDSVLGQGSTFWFTLPAPPAQPAHGQADDDGMVSLDGLRILVVDDNPINRELVSIILGPLGVEVTTAVDGLNGLEKAMSLPFDLILLDIRMPGLDGPGVLARLRSQDGPNREVPILAFSAEFDAESASGFDDFVAKPLQPEALIRAIARWTAFETEEAQDALSA